MEVVNIKKLLARTKGYFLYPLMGWGRRRREADQLLIFFLAENQFNALGLMPILEINSNKNVGNSRRTVGHEESKNSINKENCNVPNAIIFNEIKNLTRINSSKF